jgi:phosphohistidine swiveling domain-containing protein
MTTKAADYVVDLTDPAATLETAGGKGAALTDMVRAGLPVPDGFHVTTAAYREFVTANDLQGRILAELESADPEQPSTLETASRAIGQLFAEGEMVPAIAGAIAQAYAELAGQSPTVAVRSSATAEDLPEASFAGQQETYLNVQGASAVLDAVRHCWASLWTARAIGYRARHGIGVEGLSLAVVVQLLIPAEAAGIMFTADPMTGRRSEAVINAAWGLGEAVVGGQVTPDSYRVRKETGEVVERQIAEKSVMTVPVQGGTRTEPVPDDLRRAPVLDDEQAAELVGLGLEIEELYGEPRDIEWALADGAFAILQARPITALPEPGGEPPDEWPMPDPDGHYMRGSIVEFMPDPLTPLFRTLALPAISEGMQRMLGETMGGTLSFLDNYVVTVNDYAYLSFDLQGRDYWWVLTKMLPALPRLMKGAASHWEEVAHPRYAQAVADWEEKEPDSMRAGELLQGAAALTDGMGLYLTTLQLDTLGIAAGTETLFTNVYDKLVRREGDPPAPTYLLGSDSLPIQSEKALFDLAGWCRGQDDLAAHLLRTPAAQLADELHSEAVPDEVGSEAWRAWVERFRAHLDRYGHGIYDLDFAKPVPAHDPTPLLQTLKLFIGHEARDPYARQQRLADQREKAIAAVRERTRGLKRKLFDKTLRWAQTYTSLREDSIFEIGLAYPPLREMLLELGRRLAEAGSIDEAGDVFWLELAEVEQAAAALDGGEKPESSSERVERRRTKWRAEKQVTPPGQLPQKERVLGIKMDAFMPVSADEQTENRLKGVGCSPGRVTATARVLHGPEDFEQMQPGDILVADITTPAWTPLFAMAAGIVTNVGGPLSHGSIVAREYAIPAVLGTGVATRRIRSGQTITVDGSEGTVTLS